MPANLPPEYFDADKAYREAVSPQEKIAALEQLIATIPKHKGTDKIRADFRKKLSRLREEAIKKKRSGKGDLYTIERQGAAQVALAGFPNSGKSSLISVLTNAHPVIADFPMSTLMPLSAMMPYEDIQFQLVDLPPIGNEATDGWISGILRNARMLLLVVDLAEDPAVQAELLLDQLSQWHISLRRSDIKEPEGEKGKPVLIAGNKVDLPSGSDGAKILLDTYEALYPVVCVSSHEKTGLEDLRNAIFCHSHIIRVYSKEPGKPPDLGAPFSLPRGSSVMDLAEMIHKDFVSNLKYACIWGSAKFDGQRVQKDYLLRDRDIVEYHVK